MKEIRHSKMQFNAKFDIGVALLITNQIEAPTWITDNLGGNIYDMVRTQIKTLHALDIMWE